MVEPTAETLKVFVEFVRMNPLVPSNSPVIANAFHAYLGVQERDYQEQRRAHLVDVQMSHDRTAANYIDPALIDGPGVDGSMGG